MAEETIFSGESKNIEYKVSVPDKSEKYMKTIVAFANTQGGRLLIGIDDKTHEIVGVDSVNLFQIMDSIANAVSDSCEPQIIPDIEPQTVDGKKYYRCDGGGWEESPILLKIKGQGSRDIYQSGGNIKACISRKD